MGLKSICNIQQLLESWQVQNHVTVGTYKQIAHIYFKWRSLLFDPFKTKHTLLLIFHYFVFRKLFWSNWRQKLCLLLIKTYKFASLLRKVFEKAHFCNLKHVPLHHNVFSFRWEAMVRLRRNENERINDANELYLELFLIKIQKYICVILQKSLVSNYSLQCNQLRSSLCFIPTHSNPPI